MKRSSSLRRTTRLASVSERRQTQKSEYTREAARYLAEHPYCQIFCFRHELDERAVIKSRGVLVFSGKTIEVPRSEEIHHRNKRDGVRLLDKRYWMAACREQHDWVEDHKDVSRALGLLLPINARPDGMLADGSHAIATPELMAKKARRS